MRRLALAFILAIWLLLIVAVWRSEGLAARAQGEPAPVLSGNGLQIALSGNSLQIDGGLVDLAVITVRLDPQTGELSFVLAESSSATPAPTVPVPTTPPSATRTPLPPPTTLMPSATPPPTNTPRPSVTPTATPGATPVCMGTVVTTTALNIRAAPSTTASITGRAQPGQRVRVFEVSYSGNNEWARVEGGWLAAYFSGQEYVRYDVAQGCADVRFGESPNPFVTDTPRPSSTPAGPSPTPSATRTPAPFVTPTPEVMGVGWTTTFGYDAALYEAGEALRGKGYAPSVTLTSNSGEACLWAARGWRVLVRPWYQLGLGDDPDLSLSPEASARLRVQQLAAHATALCYANDNVTVQLANETTWPSADYLNRWILEAVRECAARGWSCAPVMFSVGTPELNWFPALRPALAALASGNGYLGYNSYGYFRDAMLCDLSAQYTVWRVRLMRLAAGDPFPRVWVSEAARGAGDVAPSVPDAACFVRQSKGLHANVNLWCAGACGVWDGARWSGAAMWALVAAL